MLRADRLTQEQREHILYIRRHGNGRGGGPWSHFLGGNGIGTRYHYERGEGYSVAAGTEWISDAATWLG